MNRRIVAKHSLKPFTESILPLIYQPFYRQRKQIELNSQLTVSPALAMTLTGIRKSLTSVRPDQWLFPLEQLVI